MLSHPLVKEAAETLFVPVAIRNNSKGDADAEVCAHFGEPAWNNPVVRVVAPASREDRVARLHDDWTVDALVDAMVLSLRSAEREVPGWLELLSREQIGRREVETAVFGMT